MTLGQQMISELGSIPKILVLQSVENDTEREVVSDWKRLDAYANRKRRQLGNFGQYRPMDGVLHSFEFGVIEV